MGNGFIRYQVMKGGDHPDGGALFQPFHIERRYAGKAEAFDDRDHGFSKSSMYNTFEWPVLRKELLLLPSLKKDFTW